MHTDNKEGNLQTKYDFEILNPFAPYKTQAGSQELSFLSIQNNILSRHKRSSDAKSVLCQPVASFKQLLAAYNIVYQQYFENDYIAQARTCFHFSLYELFPLSVTFIALCDQIPVGTMTTVITTNTPDALAKIPSGETFEEELANLHLGTELIAEGTKFAFSPNLKREAPFFANALVISIFNWWKMIGLSHVFVVVHPKHKIFWNHSFGFEMVSLAKSCPRVANSPGILMHLDLLNIDNSFNQSFSKTTSFRLSEVEIAILLLLEPSVVTNSPASLTHSLIKYYPSIKEILEDITTENSHENNTKISLRLFNLQNYLSKISTSLQFFAGHKGINLTWLIVNTLPLLFIADNYRLAALIINLNVFLINKSSPTTSITVEFKEKKSTDNLKSLEFSIIGHNIEVNIQELQKVITKTFRQNEKIVSDSAIKIINEENNNQNHFSITLTGYVIRVWLEKNQSLYIEVETSNILLEMEKMPRVFFANKTWLSSQSKKSISNQQSIVIVGAEAIEGNIINRAVKTLNLKTIFIDWTEKQSHIYKDTALMILAFIGRISEEIDYLFCAHSIFERGLQKTSSAIPIIGIGSRPLEEIGLKDLRSMIDIYMVKPVGVKEISYYILNFIRDRRKDQSV